MPFKISSSIVFVVVAGFLTYYAEGFSVTKRNVLLHHKPMSLHYATNNGDSDFYPFANNFELDEEIKVSKEKIDFSFLSALPILLLANEPAVADNAYGVLAGRTASMLHPLTNFALFAVSIYSAVLGFQWRRLRDISEEIKALGASLPKLSTTTAKFPLIDVKNALNAELSQLRAAQDPSSTDRISLLQKDLLAIQSVGDIETKYVELTNSRKNLQQANLKDKHHATGSILLGAGVTVSLLGAFNTYMRAGRLFPGPHLYAGMAITILWACK